MIHSSILNSKVIIIFIAILGSIFILSGEFLYSSKNVPVTYTSRHTFKVLKNYSENEGKYGIVIGDSRGKCAVNSDLLKSRVNDYEFLNISEDGAIPLNAMKEISLYKNKPEVLVVAVSPADVFGFVDSNTYKPEKKISVDLDRIFSYPFKIKNPYSISETKITDYLKENYRFILGFNEFTNLVFFGKISNYTSANGWNSNTRIGSYKAYSEILNTYYYKYKLLENNRNHNLISQIDNEIYSTIESILKGKTELVFIRVPTSLQIREVEDSKFPWFNDYFRNIEKKYNTKYITFDGFVYNGEESDGSHLSRYEAIRFSNALSDTLSRFVFKEIVLYINIIIGNLYYLET